MTQFSGRLQDPSGISPSLALPRPSSATKSERKAKSRSGRKTKDKSRKKAKSKH